MKATPSLFSVAVAAVGIAALFAQNTQTKFSTPAKAGSPTAHYYRMKLVKIMDDEGFGQPVEVARLLIPADWTTEGGVRWDSQQIRCPLNIIKLKFRAVSPDRITGIEFSPGYMWQSATDPQTQQILRQQAASRSGCDVGPPLGSIDYLRQAVLRAVPQAQVLRGESLPEVSREKQSLLDQTYAPLQRAGYVRGYKADTGSLRIQYEHGGHPVEEWWSTTVDTVGTPSANSAALMQGQVRMSAVAYSMIAEAVFIARAPAGQLDSKLVATIIASTRPNPQYEAAISQFLMNMNSIAQRGAMDRARIWKDAGDQINKTINETYEHQQAVQDRSAQQFSQAVRGVETYVNPSTGARVELTGGYDNAWINGRGEYLLSDSPGFDAAVTLHENWTQLKKAQ